MEKDIRTIKKVFIRDWCVELPFGIEDRSSDFMVLYIAMKVINKLNDRIEELEDILKSFQTNADAGDEKGE